MLVRCVAAPERGFPFPGDHLNATGCVVCNDVMQTMLVAKIYPLTGELKPTTDVMPAPEYYVMLVKSFAVVDMGRTIFDGLIVGFALVHSLRQFYANNLIKSLPLRGLKRSVLKRSL